jgi:hypothetical protein
MAHVDKNFDKRYTQGVEDIFQNYFVAEDAPKVVLVLVSHHKGIHPIIKMKYKGVPDSKKLRKHEYPEDPSYCCTL